MDAFFSLINGMTEGLRSDVNTAALALLACGFIVFAISMLRSFFDRAHDQDSDAKNRTSDLERKGKTG